MRPFPWKCGNCRERAINAATLPTYVAELEHDGRKYRVTVADLQVARCDNCGTIMLDDSANRRLSDALRTEVGLLHPAEIRAQRESLGLTQKALSGLLHVAEATLSRWETGAQIQQRAMDAFLRVFFQSSDARRILGAPEPEDLKIGQALPSHATQEFHWQFTETLDPQLAEAFHGYTGSSTFTPVSVTYPPTPLKIAKGTELAA